MCGRFAFFSNNRESLVQLGVAGLHPPAFNNYNITPSQNIPAVRISPETEKPEYVFLRWGLLPFWSKTATTRFPMINARAEGIENKPSFRGPFRHRRCIIPASGFYEWKKVGSTKQPHFIRPTAGDIFLLAGVWDHWQGGEKSIESCAIITTLPNSMIKSIHDRMPVIIDRTQSSAWLGLETPQNTLLKMLQPYSSDSMEAYPVSALVNNPRNNGSECIARAMTRQTLFDV